MGRLKDLREQIRVEFGVFRTSWRVAWTGSGRLRSFAFHAARPTSEITSYGDTRPHCVGPGMVVDRSFRFDSHGFVAPQTRIFLRA